MTPTEIFAAIKDIRELARHMEIDRRRMGYVVSRLANLDAESISRVSAEDRAAIIEAVSRLQPPFEDEPVSNEESNGLETPDAEVRPFRQRKLTEL